MQSNEILKQLDSPSRIEVKKALGIIKEAPATASREIYIKLWKVAGENEDEEDRKTALEIVKSIEPNVEKQISDFKESLLVDSLPGAYLPYCLKQLELESYKDKNQALDILWEFVQDKDKGTLISWRVFETIFDLTSSPYADRKPKDNISVKRYKGVY